MLNAESQYISNTTRSVLEDEYIAYVARTATHNGDVIGFYAGAFSVEDIHKAVSIMEPGDTGFAFLLDGFGNVMSHEQEELIMKENFTQGSEDGYAGLSDIAKSIISGNSGSDNIILPDGEKNFITYTPIKGTPWSLVRKVFC